MKLGRESGNQTEVFLVDWGVGSSRPDGEM